MRSVRPFLFMALLAMVGWFTVWANYPWANTQLIALGRAAQSIYLIFAIVVMISAGLFLPALAATAIVGEREQETFDQLSMTLIPRRGLVTAKFANAIGLYSLVVTGSFPVLGSVFFMVGLEVRLVLVTIGVLLLGCLSVTAIGVAVSSYSRRTLPALIAAYFLTAFFMGGYVFLVIVAEELLDWHVLPFTVNSNTFTTVAVATSPPVAVAAMYTGWVTPEAPYWTCIYHGSIVAVCFIATLVFLRRGPRPAPEQRGETRWLPSLGGRRPPIPDGRNAIFAKEVRWGLLRRRGRVLMWVGNILLFFVVQASIVSSWDLYAFRLDSYIGPYMRESLAASFVALMCVLLPAAPLFITNLYTKERELQNLDMLRVSLLTSNGIYYGKLVAGLRGMIPIVSGFAATGFLFFFLPILQHGHGYIVTLGFVTVFVSLWFVVGVSAFAGAASKRTSTGVVAAYAGGLFALLGFPVMVGMTADILGMHTSEIDTMVGATSPVMSWFFHIADGDEEFFLWLIVMICYSVLGTYFVLKGLRRFSRIDV